MDKTNKIMRCTEIYSLKLGCIFDIPKQNSYFCRNIMAMGNWSEQQEVKKEFKEKDKIRKEKLAGYFFDLSKLSFAGLVIGIVIPLYSNITDENNWYVVITGIMLATVSALLANKILK